MFKPNPIDRLESDLNALTLVHLVQLVTIGTPLCSRNCCATIFAQSLMEHLRSRQLETMEKGS